MIPSGWNSIIRMRIKGMITHFQIWAGRRSSRRIVKTIAERTEPLSEPMPPKNTITRDSVDFMIPKLEGLMNPSRWAKRPPAMPARKELKVNAISFMLFVLTDMISAEISS